VTKPYSYYHILGRETFLAPVDWPKNGWPQVNGNGTINIDMQVPTLPLQPFEEPVSRTEFDEPKLGYEWQYLRNPVSANYSLTERKGFLRINASPFKLNELESVSFIGRRQTEHDFTAETSLEIVSTKEEEEAGLTLIQNNTHHYDLLLKRKGKRFAVQLRVVVGSLSYLAAEELIDEPTVRLQVVGKPLNYTFSYFNTKAGKFVELKKLDTRYLSTEVAGGFTGVMIGLYASANGQKTSSKAYFDYFDYRVSKP